MTPAEQSAYAAYPQWVAELTGVLAAVKGLPLDELLVANVRMTTVGGRIDAGGVEKADPVAMDRQRALIESAIAFRDANRAATEDQT